MWGYSGGHHGNRHPSATSTNVHTCLPVFQLVPQSLAVRHYLGAVCYMWQDREATVAVPLFSERGARSSVKVLISHCETRQSLGLSLLQLWDAQPFVWNSFVLPDFAMNAIQWVTASLKAAMHYIYNHSTQYPLSLPAGDLTDAVYLPVMSLKLPDSRQLSIISHSLVVLWLSTARGMYLSSSLLS